MRRIFLAILLGLALGVYGCGKGDGGATSGEEKPAEPATTAAPEKPAEPAPEKPATEPAAAEKKAPAATGTVKIGILHSLSGTMAISETSLRDVVLMAAEEINAAGGVLGK